jgi:hypothetical protein
VTSMPAQYVMPWRGGFIHEFRGFFRAAHALE